MAWICETFGRQYKKEITGRRTATKVFMVKLDSDETYLSDVVDAALLLGLPALGDAYNPSSLASGQTGLVAISHTPNEVEQEKSLYTITIEYADDTIALNTPTNRPWQISFSSQKLEYVPEQTLFNSGTVFPIGQIKAVGINEPIVNSAGDTFDPPVTATKVLPVITLTKSFSQVSDIGTITDIEDLISRIGTVNSFTTTIAGVYFDYFQGKIEDINIAYREENGEIFYDATFVIVKNPTYWVQKVLNAGYNEAGGKKITTKDGADLANPWLLDVNGAKFPLNSTTAFKKANAIYYAFGVDEISDFDDLGLPTTF